MLIIAIFMFWNSWKKVQNLQSICGDGTIICFSRSVHLLSHQFSYTDFLMDVVALVTLWFLRLWVCTLNSYSTWLIQTPSHLSVGKSTSFLPSQHDWLRLLVMTQNVSLCPASLLNMADPDILSCFSLWVCHFFLFNMIDSYTLSYLSWWVYTLLP
jgi:hypothetical protein